MSFDNHSYPPSRTVHPPVLDITTFHLYDLAQPAVGAEAPTRLASSPEPAMVPPGPCDASRAKGERSGRKRGTGHR
eukprot:2702741-Pyramimonas_sp.AAC.1